MKTPSVGRIVHYHEYPSEGCSFTDDYPCAAIITRVHSATDGFVCLCVFDIDGFSFNDSTPYSEQPAPGCWSWPPDVPQ